MSDHDGNNFLFHERQDNNHPLVPVITAMRKIHLSPDSNNPLVYSQRKLKCEIKYDT